MILVIANNFKGMQMQDNLENNIDTIEKLVALAGGALEMARICQRHQSTVDRWVANISAIPERVIWDRLMKELPITTAQLHEVNNKIWAKMVENR